MVRDATDVAEFSALDDSVFEGRADSDDEVELVHDADAASVDKADIDTDAVLDTRAVLDSRGDDVDDAASVTVADTEDEPIEDVDGSGEEEDVATLVRLELVE